MRSWMLGIAVAAVAGSLLPASAGGLGAPNAARCSGTPMRFGTPVVLGDPDVPAQGYEPSIELDSAGTVFITAHKLDIAQEEGRLASWLWRSNDGGKTFVDMAGLSGQTTNAYALEGDFAVDGKDRLYFVDTWAADNHLYRYVDHGKTMDFYQPALGSYEVDDRPWMAAHGDGRVYYMSNTGYKHDGRLTVHRSTDGGKTFSPIGFTFPLSGWGFIDADPKSKHVYAVVNDLFYGTGPLGANTGIFAWSSPDEGLTWTKTKIAGGDSIDYPTVAVSPRDGTVYAYWNTGKKLTLAQSKDRGKTWKSYDVTPFAGKFSNSWLTVGPTGDVAMVFRGEAEDGDAAYIYAMSWREKGTCAAAPSTCKGPATSYARVDNDPAPTQEDFFQVEVGKDNAMNVAYKNGESNIFFNKQTAGPTMRGASWCGKAGRP